MSQFLKNTAGQHVQFQVIDTDGSNVTSSVVVDVSKDGGSLTGSAGTLTHLANGYWDYVPTQAETNADHLGLRVSASGAIPFAINILTATKLPSDLSDELTDLQSHGDVNWAAGGGPYEHIAVPESRTTRLTPRHDGITVGVPELSLRPGEVVTIAIDASAMVGDGELDAISNATTSDRNKVSVPTSSVDHERALIRLDASSASDGDSVDVTADLTPFAGEIIKANVTVNIKE